ncbi:MAG: PQQ-binding-like beta-propeller repeat protein [Armatimonadota bacterium]
MFQKGGIAWTALLPGIGHASPVVANGRVYAMSADETTGTRFLTCLDLVRGERLWQVPIAYPIHHHHDFNAAASSTPVVHDGRVFVLLPSPETFRVMGFDLRGNRLWERDLGSYPTQHGGGQSPIAHRGRLLFSVEPDQGDGAILALDCRTGRTVWRRASSSKDAPYASPFVRRGWDGREEIIFLSTAAGLLALDPDTGRDRWQCSDLFRLRCVGSPIEIAGVLVATSGNGGGDRLAVGVRPPSRERREPEVLWRLRRGTSYVPTPLSTPHGLLFWTDAGVAHMANPQSGETIWQERLSSTTFSSPILVDDRVWCISASGELVSFVAGSEPPRTVDRMKFDGPAHATPAVASGRFLLRAADRLHCLAGASAAR